MNLLLNLNKTVIFVCLFFYAQFSTAQSLEDMYVKMPDRLNPTLSKQNRLELIEYHKAKQGDSVANRFGNQAHVQLFDTIRQCLVVRNSPVSIFEMKLINMPDNSIVIGMINTICSPVCQSSIEFYDTAWAKIPVKFTMPKSINWLDKTKLEAADVDSVWIKNLLKTSFISLSFSKTENIIEAKNCTTDFLSDEDRKQILPLFSEKTFRYKLQGLQWIRIQ
jgi:hypothetical protein